MRMIYVCIYFITDFKLRFKFFESVRFLNTRRCDYVLYNHDNERSSLNENFIHLIDYPI